MSAPKVRSFEDLCATARALAHHFETDTVVVVGSQAVLVGWPDAPIQMRTTPEIDAYPANARAWERKHNSGATDPADVREASEEINALFGAGSNFHEAKGFYVDGVDDRTAKLPLRWQERAVYARTPGGHGPVTIVAPCLTDIVVSKLHRLEEKDRVFVETLHRTRSLDVALVIERLGACDPGPAPETITRIRTFLASLPAQPDVPPPSQAPRAAAPPYPRATHRCFVEPDGRLVVRAWDEAFGIFRHIDNPMGPAVVRPGALRDDYYLLGRVVEKRVWERAERVAKARDGELIEAEPDWAARRGGANEASPDDDRDEAIGASLPNGPK